MLADALEGRALHTSVIPKSGEPLDTGLLAKPGDLPLGVVSGICLCFEKRLVSSHPAGEHFEDLAVAVRLEWFRGRRPAHRENALDLLLETASKHLPAARIQSLIERLAGGRQAD